MKHSLFCLFVQSIRVTISILPDLLSTLTMSHKISSISETKDEVGEGERESESGLQISFEI